MTIQLMKFENLYELLKPNISHYILKYELNKKEAIYYMISDGPCFTLVGYCIDKNFEHENLKVENGKVCNCSEPTGTTIVTANVIQDTLLSQVLKYMIKDIE